MAFCINKILTHKIRMKKNLILQYNEEVNFSIIYKKKKFMRVIP